MQSADAGAAIVEKIDAAKQQGVEVLFTLDKHPPATGKAGENQPPMHCVENTEGCALYGAVARCLDGTTPAFEKQTFGSLKLAKYLEERQFAEMEFVGVSTHLCVLSNAILAQAACPNARIRIDARCVASPTGKRPKKGAFGHAGAAHGGACPKGVEPVNRQDQSIEQLYQTLTKAALTGKKACCPSAMSSWIAYCTPEAYAPVWHRGACTCREEDTSPCQKACLYQAIRRDETGKIIIDPKACTGCEACIDACQGEQLLASRDTPGHAAAYERTHRPGIRHGGPCVFGAVWKGHAGAAAHGV